MDATALSSEKYPGMLVDVCLLQNTSLLPPQADGIVLDYEVQDARTATQTAELLTSWAELVHRTPRQPKAMPGALARLARARPMHMQAKLYTNPLDAPTQKYTNINATNLYAIYRVVDRVGMMIYAGENYDGDGSMAKAIAAQKSLLDNAAAASGGIIDYANKVFVVFDMGDPADSQSKGGTTVGDAYTLRNSLLLPYAIPEVNIWRDYATPSADCGVLYNRKLDCLLFGTGAECQ